MRQRHSGGLAGPVHERFSLGDVVWTKILGYPWWPSMVTMDPRSNKHMRQNGKVTCSCHHILFLFKLNHLLQLMWIENVLTMFTMYFPSPLLCVLVCVGLNSVLYHVQYFSDASERGYVYEKAMVPFRDRHQFQELVCAQPSSRTDRKKVPAYNHMAIRVL